MTSRVAAAALVLAAVGWVSAQAPAPRVRIIEPAEDSYLSGEVRIVAVVEPRGTPVERVQFFCEGVEVCSVERPPYRCTWNAGPAIRARHIRVVATVGGRRLPASVTTKGTEFADSADVDRIKVTPVVLDGNRFVKGLPRSAFRVYEDGVRVPIEIFGSEDVGLELAVAVDISESMTDSLERVKELVKRFLTDLRPADRVWLRAFNENDFLLAQPSADLEARLAAVDTLAPWGATALHDVIVKSFGSLATQAGRHGLVVFTDGDDTASRVSAAAVERQAESSHAVLFMIGQGRAVESDDLRSLCERLARKSGGRAFFPRRVEDLAEVFSQVAEELSNQYYLTFAPLHGRDGVSHRIRVEVAGGYQVRARTVYRLDPRNPR